MRLVEMVAADRRRQQWLMGASMMALAATVPALPAQAQTLSGILAARQAAVRTTTGSTGASAIRPTSMVNALARQRAVQSQATDIRAFVTAARAAAAANRPPVTDGLSSEGLDPIAAVRQASQTTDAVERQRLLVSVSAANDTTGLATWQGAAAPVQTAPTTGADAGRTLVSINQTESRALLSWNRFNVGANTTVQFNQRSADGAAQPGWTAVNRIVNSVAPSQILGRVRADGTVVVLNNQGIIFGRDAQVNTHSLLASTLDLGNPVSIRNRNLAYVASGLLLPLTNPGTNNNQPLLVSGDPAATPATIEGAITVDAGAQITAGAGGFLIMAAPSITSGGTLRATDGQVSLQAGRAITYQVSTGAATNSVDPDVRGLILSTYDQYLAGTAPVPAPAPITPDNGIIVQTGLIESRRGYISLGTGAAGSITHSGLLSATTSVSANGKIALIGGAVTLSGSANRAQASGIEIVPDDDGRTIPQGTPDQPSGFRSSQLVIGAQRFLDVVQPIADVLQSSQFTMGQNALIYAPGATVTIGRRADDTDVLGNFLQTLPTQVTIAEGATIDVGGLKDVALDPSRNSLAITPVKRNELRDTPNYREVALDGNFTLNGATLYVDPRVSGVRADGVAWVGSPLIEAGSLASQIPSGVREFMTAGGTINLASSVLTTDLPVGTVAPSILIARGARIDFSGGWVSYAAGQVRTSALLTADGRIVNIANADPNDTYVAVIDGFTAVQPRFGITRTFANAITQASQRFEIAYDEGRDAGALVLSAPAISLQGTLNGDAYAGSRQINDGSRGSLPSGFTQDPRGLQRTNGELPSGGFLRIGSFVGEDAIALGADIAVVAGTAPVSADPSRIVIGDSLINAAGLSALTLQTTGSIDLVAGSALRLAPGGALRLDATRAITIAGSATVPSGTITARTYSGLNAEIGGGLGYLWGSPFETGDNLLLAYPTGAPATSPFDLTVTGRLSTAGLWVNDFTATGLLGGGGYNDGGSISLASAPNVFVRTTLEQVASGAVDLSGSLRVSGVLDVSAGGYVDPTGTLDLTGTGGDIAILNETVYAGLTQSLAPTPGEDGTAQSVDVTPGANVGIPTSVPDPRSVVDLTGARFIGFGFAGGGTFTLAAPDISFGSDNRPNTAHVGLSFFSDTGFGELAMRAFRSRVLPDLFTNEQANNSAFLETSVFEVRSGERLDLTQTVIPSILTSDQADALRALATGSVVLDTPGFAPVVPTSLFDRRAATLTLTGLSELDVLAGGEIVGAPGAVLNVSSLYNAGRITLRGGTIAQRAAFSGIERLLQVNDLAFGGRGLAEAFGGQTLDGRFDENAANAAGLTAPNGTLLTNAQLVSDPGNERQIYFGGRNTAGEGIHLVAGRASDGTAAGIDLSGIALYDSRAIARTDGVQLRIGRVLSGGTLSLAGTQGLAPAGTPLFSETTYGVRGYGFEGDAPAITRGATLGREIVAESGSFIDISGASGVYDLRVGGTVFAAYRDDLQWSNAGTVSALGGGSIVRAAVDAHGGAERASGGVLAWRLPTLTDDDRGGAADRLTQRFFDDANGFGFDVLAASGGLRIDGDAVNISIGKALLVASATPLTNNTVAVDADIRISATEGSVATINAPYIRFASRIAPIASNVAANPETGADITFGGATAGIDIVGGIAFDRSIASVTLSSPGDVRFTGVNTAAPGDPTAQSTLNGSLTSAGDLTIDARRVYATTGTGNLQALLEGRATGAPPFAITALGDSTVTFGNSFLDPAATAPLSAGTRLQVIATRIVQNGYLAAPLGEIQLGTNATEGVSFGAGSVTTVSGNGLRIPFGTTTDGIEYFFLPNGSTALTQLPTGSLAITGGTIDMAAGARVDGRGGGDVFAFEFQSGVGGSRDVLDRLNTDRFSSNGYDAALGYGYQFADARQVYAAVPIGTGDAVAPFDPIYSADYGSNGPVDLYGISVGSTVTLDGVDGAPGQRYLLLPAHYALAIPGAVRLVENTGTSAPIPGVAQALLDGSRVVGGTFGSIGSDESLRRSFTIQTPAVFGRYSQIITTSGTSAVLATSRAPTRPALPLDAARVVLAPLEALRIAGVFDTTPASSGGIDGFSSRFDIRAENLLVTSDPDAVGNGSQVVLSSSTLAQLNAGSLLIGGQRTDNVNGTTTVQVSAKSIEIAGDATLAVPDLLLAVGGAFSSILINDGATLTATAGGRFDPARTGDYVIANVAPGGSGFDESGLGTELRLSSAPERLFLRQQAPRQSTAPRTELRIGAATLTGNALAIDTTRFVFIDPRALITVPNFALSTDEIVFDGAAFRTDAIDPALEARLAQAQHVTLRSSSAVRFSPGTHSFRDLTIDAPGVAFIRRAEGDATLELNAGAVTLTNSTNSKDVCTTVALICGSGSAITLNSTSLTFGTNTFRFDNVADTVTLAASGGMRVAGKGALQVDGADLTLRTPYLADLSTVEDPQLQPVRPDFTFLTTADIAILGQGAVPTPTTGQSPGARINFGTADAPINSLLVSGSAVRATSGVIDVESRGTITVSGATLAAPGYLKVFGAAGSDSVTVAASGGALNLVSLNGDILVRNGSTLISDTGAGNAGAINLIASRGAIELNLANPATDAGAVRINPGLTGARAGSIAFDSGLSGFALGDFASRYGTLFGGDIAIRSGAGDLVLDANQRLRAASVLLTADRAAGATTGGAIRIAGTIDTSGVSITGLTGDALRNARVDGGDIALWGAAGVTLQAGSLLDTHTTGYADLDTRSSSGGDVTIGIIRPDAAIVVAPGARIDVGARRTEAAIAVGETGARLIPDVQVDPVTLSKSTTYRYVEADTGGTVRFRAPVIGANGDQVALTLGGTISGAASRQVEAFRTYDLNALAALADLGEISGVSASSGSTYLDFSQDTSTGFLQNPFTEKFTLSDGTPSVVQFIQDFRLSAQDGSSLAGFRLRPGIELTSTGSITTYSPWNLAAATFTQEALDRATMGPNPDLIVNPTLGDVFTVGTQYTVVPGREAHFIETAANFLYRVGGTVRPDPNNPLQGEAPVVTFRAGFTLNLDRSISDGFFTFRDKSDANYINYQLGGGNRSFSPAIVFSCGGAQNCADLQTVDEVGTGRPDLSRTVLISLVAPIVGGTVTSPEFTNSPLAVSGNGAAAIGTNFDDVGNVSGDPLGFAELFPRVFVDPDDPNSASSAVRSSDIRLVAGTGPQVSANPLHVDRASGGDVLITGEINYRLDALKGFGLYSGPLQFRLLAPNRDDGSLRPYSFDIGDTFDVPGDFPLGISELQEDAYGRIFWGSGTDGLTADARDFAMQYFGADADYTGVKGLPTTGVAASVAELVGFFEAFEPIFQEGLASRRYVFNDPRFPNPINFGSAFGLTPRGSAFAKTYVRTGDGRIDVAAGQDVAIVGSTTPEYRTPQLTLTQNPNGSATQYASAAIYTAGTRVAATLPTARIVGSDATLQVTLDSPYLVNGPERTDFVPSPVRLSDTTPALANNGGAVTVTAGRDVLGRRDEFSETQLASGNAGYSGPGNDRISNAGGTIGFLANAWRVGTIDVDTEIGISPRYFTSGVGALAGGDVRIRSGRDVTDLTVALDAGISTVGTSAGLVAATLGHGDLTLAAGRDLYAPRIDVANGLGVVTAGGNLLGTGQEIQVGGPNDVNYTPSSNTAFARIRLADAFVSIGIAGSANIGSISSLGASAGAGQLTSNSLSLFGSRAGVGVTAGENVRLYSNQRGELTSTNYGEGVGIQALQILPPYLLTAALAGEVRIDSNVIHIQYPSPTGGLALFSAASLNNLRLSLSDSEATLFGGLFAPNLGTNALVRPNEPLALPTLDDNALRLQHSDTILHRGDAERIQVVSGGDIIDSAFYFPKHADIVAGGDIRNLVFQGQNVGAADTSRVIAGGDIFATSASSIDRLNFYRGNVIYVGGPGELVVQAGGSIGPFATSATIAGVDYQGGIATVGNDFNPYLPEQGASVDLRFGVGGGMDFTALRETYLNPANAAQLDGDLFVQVTDAFGNDGPDRSRPIYAPILAQWLQENDPADFLAIFGQAYGTDAAGQSALAEAAYGQQEALYQAFTGTGAFAGSTTKPSSFQQQSFLTKQLFFNELAATAVPTSASYLQYIRGYRAVETLFPTAAGYTDNLANYVTDPATVDEDNPQGVPTRVVVNGQPQPAARVTTGNVDLRLASLETRHGGDVTIIGPGGNFVAGSVVRTSEQVLRRGAALPLLLPGLGAGSTQAFRFSAVPQGYEGVLTVRGGQVRSFTDGDLLLNQSRLFTVSGGDITAWSSNGNLNAGQGPKSAGTFPRITVRFNPDAFSSVSSAGAISGAGIGTFKPVPEAPDSDVLLIAPVGEVDAGDAGVRASGNVFVAAARVANADNFQAGGDIVGVPSAALTAAPVVPDSAASAIAAQVARLADPTAGLREGRTLISVEVLGPSEVNCDDPDNRDDPSCRAFDRAN